MIYPFKTWNITRFLFLIAGSVVFLSTLFGIFVHPYFFALPLLVGIMQTMYALFGFCPMAFFLRKCGIKGEQ